MKIKNFAKIFRGKILYTFLAALLLCSVFLTMIGFIYDNAKEQAFEQLHLQTKQIKEDIYVQMNSDLENLRTMASFAAKLYDDGESYDLIFDSFKSIGLIKNIGILLPDNTFITKIGTIKLNETVSFADEAAKGEYISGRVRDFTNDEREVVRSCAPIKSDGEVVAILYGVTELDALKQRYMDTAEDLRAQLYVFERGNGKYIIDTFHNELGDITSLKDVKYEDEFSYDLLIKNVSNGEPGYTAFMSRVINEMLYMHYSSLGIGDWQIMLAQPERDVFESARYIESLLFIMFALIVVIMLLYLLLIYTTERKQTKLNAHASETRKLLLEINQQHSSINEALENVAKFAKARSAFFVDSDGENYSYILPELKDRLISGDDLKYLVTEIMSIAGNHQYIESVNVGVWSIKANSNLNNEKPDFYKFLKNHGIYNISFAGLTDKNNHMCILAVANTKNGKAARELLQKIIVCFSIAISNKKHLNKTEMAAITDSLTGLANRVEYKKDIIKFDEQRPGNFACVYIDVNELHIWNNTFGHAAGDAMLLYVANTLKEVFFGFNIYRIGGDEFLVFGQNTSEEFIKNSVLALKDKLKVMNYHISAGTSFKTLNTDTEELVKEAEVRMYADKALYYQTKETEKNGKFEEDGFKHINTGIEELDKCLSIMSGHYHGIYRVSLKTNKVRRILMPAYLHYGEKEDNFSGIFTGYVNDNVNPDFHRAMISFLNYEVIIKQLSEGNVPRITYRKTNGDAVVLSVYALDGLAEDYTETLWVFERA